MAERDKGQLVTTYTFHDSEYDTLLNKGDILPVGSLVSGLDEQARSGQVQTLFFAVKPTEAALTSWGVTITDRSSN